MRCIILMSIICGTLGSPVEDDALQEFTTGNHRFTSAIYKEIIKKESGNLIVSPLSAEIILALTNEGARGVTSEELESGLSLPNSKEKTRKAIRSLLPTLRKNDEYVKLLSANKIFAAGDLEVKDEFRSTATSVYNADVGSIDFSNREAATNEINNWVEKKTDGKIKELIKSKDIDEHTRLVLVNAIYFNAKWRYKFDESKTTKKKFFKTRDTAVEVDTMYMLNNFRYSENKILNAKILEIPYKGEDISMVIVLPNEIDGLTGLEQNIEEILAPQKFFNVEVNVEIPKFSIQTETQFIPILEKLGVRKLIAPGADLNGIFTSAENLYVNDVIQKAFINVTEEGTEAAASTAVLTKPYSLSSGVRFYADRSFLYLIKLKEIIVFIGRVVNPSG